MKKMYYSFIVAVFTVFIISYAGFAAVPPDKIGTEDASFLKIEPSTRPVAMGGAFVGLANDVNAVFWNPAGLTQIEKSELTTMYNAWFAGIRYASGAYSKPVGKNAAIALSMQGLWTDIEKRVEDTEKPDSTINVYSYAAGVSGSFALVPKMFSVGGTVKFLKQNLDVEDSNGVAADIGALIHVSNLGIGIAIQNLKLQMSNDGKLPLCFRVGGAYQLTKSTVFAGDYTKYGASDPAYHVGVEKWFRDIFAIRVGYNISSGDNPSKGLSAGFGLKAYGTKPLEDMNFQLDYAYVPAPDWGTMGDTHRISMIVRF
jgi:hypothetical protein